MDCVKTYSSFLWSKTSSADLGQPDEAGIAVFFWMLNGLCQQNWVITNAMLAGITAITNQAQGMAAMGPPLRFPGLGRVAGTVSRYLKNHRDVSKLQGQCEA
eukprot:COSAG06_NODE_256_length_18974_cov_73.772026_9_plen_102_part_00